MGAVIGDDDDGAVGEVGYHQGGLGGKMRGLPIDCFFILSI